MKEQARVAYTSGTDDRTLGLLVELTVCSIREKKPLFTSIQDEPVFFRRHFRRWIEEFEEEEAAIAIAAHNSLNLPAKSSI
jgi:hypothetical protein